MLGGTCYAVTERERTVLKNTDGKPRSFMCATLLVVPITMSLRPGGGGRLIRTSNACSTCTRCHVAMIDRDGNRLEEGGNCAWPHRVGEAGSDSHELQNPLQVVQNDERLR